MSAPAPEPPISPEPIPVEVGDIRLMGYDVVEVVEVQPRGVAVVVGSTYQGRVACGRLGAPLTDDDLAELGYELHEPHDDEEPPEDVELALVEPEPPPAVQGVPMREPVPERPALAPPGWGGQETSHGLRRSGDVTNRLGPNDTTNGGQVPPRHVQGQQTPAPSRGGQSASAPIQRRESAPVVSNPTTSRGAALVNNKRGAPEQNPNAPRARVAVATPPIPRPEDGIAAEVAPPAPRPDDYVEPPLESYEDGDDGATPYDDPLDR